MISVGAVDANGEHMLFSNEGSTLSASAPGYLVNTAWSNGESVAFSGTSASAPIVSGAIAALMSSGTGTPMTAAQAWSVLQTNLDDAGAPGPDPVYGGGLIDLGRALRSGIPGIVDAAIASNYVAPSASSPENPVLEVTVQNRGTTPLVNATVETTIPAGTTTFNIPTLPVGQIATFDVPLYTTPGTPVPISSEVRLSGGQTDAFPANNRRADLHPSVRSLAATSQKGNGGILPNNCSLAFLPVCKNAGRIRRCSRFLIPSRPRSFLRTTPLAIAMAAALPSTLPLQAGETFHTAPNPDAPLVSQLIISGNACGPAALLNALRLGSPDWQRPAAALPGNTDRDRLGFLIRRYGIGLPPP